MRFDNSYARLPGHMFSPETPTPVSAPHLFALNSALAQELGLNPETLRSPEWVEVFAGNHLPKGAQPIGQAYAGHQFGGWVPTLGDGRAMLLGEHIAPDGSRWDIQLKGAGRTQWSRMGDGRAWLGPVMREYLISEAMHALGIPTTRALAAVTTGDLVYREGGLPGAILTRVAPSHLRVGTFQYFAAREDLAALQLLSDMAIARHYPKAQNPLDLLAAATAAQARLIAQWMSVGFIHGVMNTDNAHVGGLTLDYGPCAFMDDFHPNRTFSSIDRQGRYSYANQPQMAVWNMAQLASALLPLLAPTEDEAVDLATPIVHGFEAIFQAEWLARFRAKIGLTTAEDGDKALIEQLLSRMATFRADFTRTFRGLSEGTAAAEFAEPEAFTTWAQDWQARLAREGRTPAEAAPDMARVNPAVIARNHRVEAAIQAAAAGDFAPFETLQTSLATPYEAAFTDPLRLAPTPPEAVRQTFCGT